VTLLAALVLALNDHLLKQLWPGLVTGKLSDVAGLVVAPPLLALLLCRRADLTATLLTGALFALVKSTETGAEAASHALTALAGPSRVLADPTDLIALPALGLTWWVRRRGLQPPARRRPLIVVLPLAMLTVLTVTATGAVQDPPSAESVVVRPDDRAVVILGAFREDLVSKDGMTWHPWHNGAALPPEIGPGMGASCLKEHCYRIARNQMKVLRSTDGGETWAVDWQVPAGQVRMLDRALPDSHEHEPLRSRSLAVLARPAGHVVIVANGRDGVAVRDETGAWRRLGFTDDRRLSESAAVPLDRPAGSGAEMWVAALAFAWVTLAALAAQVTRRGRRGRPIAVALLGGVGALLLAPWPTVVLGPAPLLGAALLISMMIAAGGLVSDAGIGSRGVGAALGVGVLAGLAVAVPFRMWGAGWIDHGPALGLALVLATLVVSVGLPVLRSSARRWAVRAAPPGPL